MHGRTINLSILGLPVGLEGDLKAQFEDWSTAVTDKVTCALWKALESLANPYYQAHRAAPSDHPQGSLVSLVGLRCTEPGLEPRKQRIYPTPWARHSRKADYAAAWTALGDPIGNDQAHPVGDDAKVRR